MPPPASAPGRRPRDRRPVARTSLAVAAAASLVLLLSLSGAALAQDDAEELARIAAVTTVLDLSSPTPSFSGGRLALAGGRAAAVAEGAPSEGAGPVSAEEAEAAYDALQAQVEARLEQERLDAVRVLDLARQANRRTAGEGEGVAGAVGAGDGGGAPADAALADADAPSAEEVARAAAIAENPWRAHRCTTAQLSDGARDEMDAAVRAHLQEEEQQQQAGGGGARRRLRRLSRRRRSLLARPSAPVPSALAHRHDRAFRSHSHDHNRALRTAEDPFDVEFTPDPFAGVPASAVAAAADRARRNPTVVPTYLHVVTPSATAGAGRGAVADASLLAQLRVLNATYASAGFAFRLEAVTRVVSSSFATAEVGSGPERAMKTALRRGGRDSLNVYVTSPPALLGWSSFPESARSDRQYDGVVIGFYTLPGSTLKPYNQGMTMAHEIGHWLGLLHTFEGSQCGSLGDRVNDTPRESAPAFGCPAEGAVDSCPSDPGADSTSNFMQYTDDACMSAFTSGQVARMSALWRRYRGSSGEGALLSEGDGGDGSSGDAAEAPAPAPEREGGDAGAAAAAAEDAAAGADAPAAPPPPPPPPRRRRRVVRGG